MKRHAAVVAVLVLALGLATPGPARAVSPACSGDGTFCISYDAHVYAPGTTTDETRTQHPVDLTLDLTNTSAGHATDSGTWVHQLTVQPLTVSLTSGPLVTRSSLLPDHLLVAGSGSGSGTGYAQGGSCPSGICAFAFTVQQVSNVQSTTHRNEFTIELSGCMTAPINTCGFASFGFATNVSFDPSASNAGTTEMTFILDPTGSGFDQFTIDTLHLTLDGSTDQTTTGPADKTYNWFRLPASCGSASGSASAMDNAGQTVAVNKAFSVTGCLDVTGTATPTLVRYGGHATLAGGLSRTDTDSPAVSGAPLVLRACPVSTACSTTSATAGSTGGWSWSVTPKRNTTYAVLYAGPAGDSDWVPTGRTFSIKVRPVVSRHVASTRIASGSTVRVTGGVTPNDAGATAVLQRYIRGTWRAIGTTKVTTRSTYLLKAVLKGPKGSRTSLRVEVLANPRLTTATSTPLTMTLM